MTLHVTDRRAAERFLSDATVEVLGRMPWSSNATFLAKLTGEVDEHLGIYKPVRGERELWDFPRGLDRREVAADRLAQLMGFDCVPPTVQRDGPLGPGSMQWFVEADHAEHYFTIYEERPELHVQLRRIALLDIVANNTDRKGGHCLLEADRVWAIDNGLCFSTDARLRTVIWEFAGESLDEVERAALDTVLETTDPTRDPADDRWWEELLEPDEWAAVRHRAEVMSTHGRFPHPGGGHPYPWPLI